jgi:hypothetical protein
MIAPMCVRNGFCVLLRYFYKLFFSSPSTNIWHKIIHESLAKNLKIIFMIFAIIVDHQTPQSQLVKKPFIVPTIGLLTYYKYTTQFNLKLSHVIFLNK